MEYGVEAIVAGGREGGGRVLGSLGSAAWGYAAFSRLGGCGKQPRLETVKASSTERGRVGRVEKDRDGGRRTSAEDLRK